MALRERNLISTATARRYLRVDDEDEDVLIELMIDAALDDVEGILNHDFTHIDDAGQLVEDEVPAKVKIAAYRMLGSHYEYREYGTRIERVGDEMRERRPPSEEREALAGELFSYRKPPGF